MMMKQPELIFVPIPSIGHIVSTLELAKCLTDRDERISITVLVMKLPHFNHVDAYTKSVAAAHPRIKFIELPQVDSPPIELRKRCIEYFNDLFIESQIENVRHVVSEILLSHSESDSIRVTGLVVDLFCVSMADVATELGLPFYVYFPTNAGFLSFMLYLATHPEKLVESLDSELIIPGFVNPVPTSVLPPGFFTKDGFPIYMKLAQKFINVDGILINTVSELEPYVIASFSSTLTAPVYTVGPLLDTKGQINPNIDKNQCPEILKWLDAQPEASVVYLCFGNGGIFRPAQVNEIATGLELSGQKFLWSLQVSELEFEFPEGFLKRVSGKGVICKWSPQVEVLSHKAIGGFVPIAAGIQSWRACGLACQL